MVAYLLEDRREYIRFNDVYGDKNAFFHTCFQQPLKLNSLFLDLCYIGW